MSNFREKVWVKLLSCFIVGIFLFSEFTWTKNLDFASLVLSNTIFYRKIVSQKIEKSSFLERILEERQKKENLLNRLRLLLLPEASAKEIEGFYSSYYGVKIESTNPYVFTPLKIQNDTVNRFDDTVTKVVKIDTVGEKITVSKNPTSSKQSIENPSSLITRLAGFLNDCWKLLLSMVGLNVSNSETERDGTVSFPTLTQKMEEKGYRLFEPKNKASFNINIKEGDILVIDEGKKNEEGKPILHVIKVTEVNEKKIKYEDERGGKIRPQEISIEELKPKIKYMYSQEARKGWSEISTVSSDIFIGGVPSDKIPTGTAYKPQEIEGKDSGFSLSSQGIPEGIKGSDDTVSDTVSDTVLEIENSNLGIDTDTSSDDKVTLNNGDTVSLSPSQKNTLQEGKPLFVAKGRDGEYRIAYTIGELESETNLEEVFMLSSDKESIQLPQSYVDMVKNNKKIMVIQSKGEISVKQIEKEGKSIQKDDKVIVIDKEANLILSGEAFQKILGAGEKESAILEITLDKEKKTISAKTTSDLKGGEDKIFVFISNQGEDTNFEKKNIIEGLFRVGSEGLRESLLKTGPPSKIAEAQSSNGENSVSQSSQEKIVVFALQPSSEEEKVKVLIKREGKTLLLSFSKGKTTLHINILNSEKENSVEKDPLNKEKEDDTVRVSTNDTVIEAIDLGLSLSNNLNNSSGSSEAVITLTKENGKTKAIVENLEENQVLDVALALLNKNIDVVEAKLKTQDGEVALTFIRKENKREIAEAVDNKDVLTVVIDGNKWSISSEKVNKPSTALSTALSALAKNATEVKVELAEGFQITLRKESGDTIVIDAGNIKDLATLINLTSLVVKESSQLDNFAKEQKSERIIVNGYGLNVTAVFSPAEKGEEGFYIFVNSKSKNQTINSDNNKDIISSNSGEVYYISLASISDIQPSDNLWWVFKEKDITKASWFREPPTGIPKNNASLMPVAFLTLTSKNSSQASIFGKSKESSGKVSDKVVDVPASATEFNIERLVNNIQEQNYLIWIVRGPPSIEFLVGSFSPASRLIDSIIKNPFSIYNSAVDFVKKNVVIPEDKNPVIPQLNSLKGPNPTKAGEIVGILTNDIPHAIYNAVCNFSKGSILGLPFGPVGSFIAGIANTLYPHSVEKTASFITSSLWGKKEENSSHNIASNPTMTGAEKDVLKYWNFVEKEGKIVAVPKGFEKVEAMVKEKKEEVEAKRKELDKYFIIKDNKLFYRENVNREEAEKVYKEYLQAVNEYNQLINQYYEKDSEGNWVYKVSPEAKEALEEYNKLIEDSPYEYKYCLLYTSPSPRD